MASLTTSRPSRVALPAVGSSWVARILTRVVLPAPFIPMRENTPRDGTLRVTESRALFCCEAAYTFVSESQRSSPSVMPADGVRTAPL